MSPDWLQILRSDSAAEPRRVALRPGLTRIGGGDADISIAGVDSDQLHVWDRPTRAVFVGAGVRPSMGGREFDEVQLATGDEIRWRDVTIRFEAGDGGPRARLEEIHAGDATPRAADKPVGGRARTAAGLSPLEEEAWQRLRAGLLVELGVADRVTVRRWQQAVRDGNFEAGDCAREIMARSSVEVDERRLVSRAGQILRDFLMISLQRGVKGSGRQAKRAAKSGVAFLIAQGTALGIFVLIVLAAALLLRLQGTSVDGLLDKLLPS